MQQNIIPTTIQSDSVEVLTGVERVAEFIQFVQWFATPARCRELKTQKEFAASVGVCEDTITAWKRNPSFWPLMRKMLGGWIKERVPEIVDGLYSKVCEKGGAAEAELLFRLAGFEISERSKKKK